MYACRLWLKPLALQAAQPGAAWRSKNPGLHSQGQTPCAVPLPVYLRSAVLLGRGTFTQCRKLAQTLGSAYMPLGVVSLEQGRHPPTV